MRLRACESPQNIQCVLQASAPILGRDPIIEIIRNFVFIENCRWLDDCDEGQSQW